MKSLKKRTQPKADKQRRSARSSKSKFVQPRTLEEFSAISEEEQEFWNNIAQAVTEVRKGSTVPQAEREFGLRRGTLRRRSAISFPQT